jgi:hypothetical protein
MALNGGNDAFKYDIAFSFVKEDEGLATQINDLVQDRYRTFLYSKAQDQLVGTDGEKTFNAVFGEEARTVAVLLRPEWGQTSWTRIEETAIRNRAYSQGYDFATFIVTAPRTPPEWLPKTCIWYDLERFGLNGAATLLERRVQERGGIVVQETLADRVARLQRAQDFNQQREAFQRSYEGVKAAQEAHRRLVDDFKANRELLHRAGCRIQDIAYGGITMLVGKGVVLTGKDVVLTGKGVVLTVRAHFPIVNSLENTELVVEFYDGVPRLPGLLVFEDPRTLKTWRFKFELVGPDRTAWVGQGHAHAPEAAEFLLKHFMELQQRQLGQAE